MIEFFCLIVIWCFVLFDCVCCCELLIMCVSVDVVCVCVLMLLCVWCGGDCKC